MSDDDYLTAVLNCDDLSGEAHDAAWRAVREVTRRADEAEAAIQRVRDECDKRMDLADATIAWEGGFIEGWNHALDRFAAALDGPE